MSARTKAGCWTCRIRKKKCDELQPICVTCSSREIPCHGYGTKPVWLYGSRTGHEAEEVKEIKRAADKSYRARRTRWPSSPNFTVEQGRSQNRQTKFPLDFIPPSCNDSEVAIRFKTASDPNANPEALPHPLKSESKFATYLNSYSLEPLWWDSGFSNEYSIVNKNELALFMVYLEQVFPLQFGFYKSSDFSQGIDWYLQTLQRSKPLLHASLSVTECFLERFRSGAHAEVLYTDELRRLYTMSLAELQKQVDSLSNLTGLKLLTESITILACMNQLLSLELFRAFEGTWEMHWRAAKALLVMVNRKLSEMHKFDPFSDNWLPPISIQESLTDSSFLSPSNYAALVFFLTGYVWLDVIANATFRPEVSSNEFKYRNLLRTHKIDLSKVMGCQNDVILIIYDINNLNAWKKAGQDSGTLSDPELMHRAAILEGQLASITVDLTESKSSLRSNTLITQNEADSNIVTEMFARAALTYLQVVVFGAYPNIPQVQASVRQGVEALARLPARLMIRTSWPICIIGCMAEKEDQAQVEKILDSASHEGVILGTVWKSRKIMNECWRMRNESKLGSGPSGWVEAMESLGVRVLLL